MLAQHVAHYGIDGELVGTGVDAELEVVLKAELLDGKVDDQEVLLEFTGELGEVSAVIHTLVEPSGKLRGDGLHRNAFSGECHQDEEELDRSLGLLYLIHGNFSDKVVCALCRGDVRIYASGFLGSGKIPRCNGAEEGLIHLEWLLNSGNHKVSGICHGFLYESIHRSGVGLFPDVLGDIDSEEVRVRDEPVHVLQVDVVGIYEILSGVTQGLDCLIGLHPD